MIEPEQQQIVRHAMDDTGSLWTAIYALAGAWFSSFLGLIYFIWGRFIDVNKKIDDKYSKNDVDHLIDLNIKPINNSVEKIEKTVEKLDEKLDRIIRDLHRLPPDSD